MSRLLAEGFAPALAARTYTTVAHYTVGFALQLALESSADGTAPSRSEAGRLPATARVAAHLDSDLHDEFVFGLTMLLDGIAASRA